MSHPLRWTGLLHGSSRELDVPASPAQPFTTDLASVPRCLTWLFPRYGKYTKAAVLHDYLCQNFGRAPNGATDRSLLPLHDRSDADEVFRVVMAELGVPWLRRWLMWSAVSWATLMTSLVPGRRSKPVARKLGRALAVAAMAAAAVNLVIAANWAALGWAGLVIPAGVAAGGTVALGRSDRLGLYAGAYAMTVAFSPLLLMGGVVAVLLYVYLFIEDVLAGLPGTRRLFDDLFSAKAKKAKLASPQFARLAAVIES